MKNKYEKIRLEWINFLERFSANQLDIKFDKTEIPGIRDTIGYLDANKFNPDELVDIFMKKFFFI